MELCDWLPRWCSHISDTLGSGFISKGKTMMLVLCHVTRLAHSQEKKMELLMSVFHICEVLCALDGITLFPLQNKLTVQQQLTPKGPVSKACPQLRWGEARGGKITASLQHWMFRTLFLVLQDRLTVSRMSVFPPTCAAPAVNLCLSPGPQCLNHTCFHSGVQNLNLSVPNKPPSLPTFFSHCPQFCH